MTIPKPILFLGHPRLGFGHGADRLPSRPIAVVLRANARLVEVHVTIVVQAIRNGRKIDAVLAHVVQRTIAAATTRSGEIDGGG